MAIARVLVATLALVALASASPSPRRSGDVATVVLKTPVPLSTDLVPAEGRTGFMTITEDKVNVTTNSANFNWELVGASVFDTKLATPTSLKIVAFRPHYPIANGETILNLTPVDGFNVEPMWNNFTLAQLNAGRAAVGLAPAVLDTDWENGNGTLVINGGDMMYVLTYADGKSDAGFASWVSDLPFDGEPSEDLYYAAEVSNTTSLPGTNAFISPQDYWTLFVSDNEDGTWQGTLFTTTNTTTLVTNSVSLVALKAGSYVTLVDLTPRLDIEVSKGGVGYDNMKAFTRAELNAALKANGFSATTPVLVQVKSTKDGVSYTNIAPMDPEWNVDPNVSGIPAPPPSPPAPKPSPKPLTPTKKPSPKPVTPTKKPSPKPPVKKPTKKPSPSKKPSKKPAPPPKKKSPPKKRN